MFDLLDKIGCDYRRLPGWLIRMSYRSCSALTGSRESWCSLAHRHQRRFWLRVLGPKHCRDCFEFWRD
jgi:hypothetical protein